MSAGAAHVISNQLHKPALLKGTYADAPTKILIVAKDRCRRVLVDLGEGSDLVDSWAQRRVAGLVRSSVKAFISTSSATTSTELRCSPTG